MGLDNNHSSCYITTLLEYSGPAEICIYMSRIVERFFSVVVRGTVCHPSTDLNNNKKVNRIFMAFLEKKCLFTVPFTWILTTNINFIVSCVFWPAGHCWEWPSGRRRDLFLPASSWPAPGLAPKQFKPKIQQVKDDLQRSVHQLNKLPLIFVFTSFRYVKFHFF